MIMHVCHRDPSQRSGGTHKADDQKKPHDKNSSLRNCEQLPELRVRHRVQLLQAIDLVHRVRQLGRVRPDKKPVSSQKKNTHIHTHISSSSPSQVPSLDP